MLQDGADVSAGRINHQTDGKVRLRMLELGSVAKEVLAVLKACSIEGDQSRDLPGP